VSLSQICTANPSRTLVRARPLLLTCCHSQTQRDFFETIGDFKGPTAGKFDVWVQRYMCWTHAAAVARSPDSLDTVSTTALPCGHVIDGVYGQQDLRDTGYRPRKLADFAVDGVEYSPEKFHIADYCDCWFYR
jgi:hypothetical protein